MSPEGLAQLISLAWRPLSDQETSLLFHISWIPHRYNAVFGHDIEEKLFAAGPAADKPGLLRRDGQHQQIEITTDTSIAM